MAGPLKIVIVADKFKGSLTSPEVAAIIGEGLRKGSSLELEIKSIPIADGGDGFLDAIFRTVVCEKHDSMVFDPLGRKIKSGFLMSEGRAIIEMAKASGLQLLSPKEYNPLKTTTYGLGELIKKAIDAGAKEILIGIGGSATNDCGTGMLQALGYNFLDNKGKAIEQADLVITGEGRLDAQSLSGKLVEGISHLARQYNKPLWVFCGENKLSVAQSNKLHIDKIFSIYEEAENLDDSISRASEILRKISASSATFLNQLQSNRQTN